MADPRKPIFDAVRAARGKGFSKAEVVILDKALDDLGVAKAGAGKPGEPDWLTEARSLIGTREIVGPRHNSWIAKGWGRLGATWFNDDETPWCGLFVAHCIDAVGLKFPKPSLFPRAKAWADWGKPCGRMLGAVAVFGRTGGGHVGFLVGESATNLYILGGNQSNAVNIMPIAKTRLIATRWPKERAISGVLAPQMSGGTVSRNEA